MAPEGHQRRAAAPQHGYGLPTRPCVHYSHYPSYEYYNITITNRLCSIIICLNMHYSIIISINYKLSIRMSEGSTQADSQIRGMELPSCGFSDCALTVVRNSSRWPMTARDRLSAHLDRAHLRGRRADYSDVWL